MEVTGRKLEQLLDQMRREDAKFDLEVRAKLRENGGPAQVALYFKDRVLAYFNKAAKPTVQKVVEVETKPVTTVTTKKKKATPPKRSILS
jgi:hypothetical protein